MSGLEGKECKPCKGSVSPIGREEAQKLLRQIDGSWSLIDNHHIERSWSFENFEKALEFVNYAGAICEKEGHHADFELGWGRAKAVIWTHKIDGLTESDFILAAKLDLLD
jgi:4a-hydroxytetrahydrobiopterin dehydratase